MMIKEIMAQLEYKTFTALHTDELDRVMTEALNDKWRPQGGIVKLPNGLLAQAAIRCPSCANREKEREHAGQKGRQQVEDRLRKADIQNQVGS